MQKKSAHEGGLGKKGGADGSIGAAANGAILAEGGAGKFGGAQIEGFPNIPNNVQPGVAKYKGNSLGPKVALTNLIE